LIDYTVMNQMLFTGKAPVVKEMTEQGLAEGITAQELLNEGLIAGMNVVGEDFKQNRVYLPEVLIAARAMKASMEILKPLLSAGGEDSVGMGTIVMGTVKGDLHDIGKNIVCMMAEGAGFKVINIGVDQSAEKFIHAAKENNANIVGMSALLTTTMVYMKTVIDAFKEEGLDQVKLCIGGAPINQMFADEIGADGYAGDASSAVELFKKLIKELKQATV